jgi:hypothetical protein
MPVLRIESPQLHDRIQESRERARSARAGPFLPVALIQVMN